MDLFAHGLWALALFKRFPWSWQAAAFAVLPDLFFGLPALFAGISLGRGWQNNYEKIFPKVEPFYRTSHSLVTMFLCFAGASLFFGEPQWGVLAGWGLHILLDAPVHRGGWVDGQAVLYPLSQKRIRGKWWFKEEVEKRPWIVAINYALALLVYFFA